ncbi:uncharacterized protein LOC116337552 [Contarinia nasturtii]|uniref:uncharacterized protein LOC116337552 n=1 Tax=Contarinia nasturtii TaxID=265458 RepID=UPI0012D38FDA|nr:uncharacterized protein LOC116337552 [Contarinia nasturtii]
MGKEKEESESQYGFKNKEKAEETVKLLAEHDIQYQKLTVRGLLGRAKRVLQITKAEDKKANIQAAIKVFENWLEENPSASSSSKKNSESSKEDKEKPETVPGLGFKDEEAALNTLKILEGRDPNYQKLAVKGLIGNSKRVLQSTKNEEKIQSIKAGVKILDNFLEDFDRENRGAQNMAYLPVDIVTAFDKPKDKLVIEFIEIYDGKARGRYEHLRTLHPKSDDSKTWDIIRNKQLEKINKKIKENKSKLFNDNGSPTKEHLELIHWAYSPNADKLKTYVESGNEKSNTQKRKSTNDDGSVPEKKKK